MVIGSDVPARAGCSLKDAGEALELHGATDTGAKRGDEQPPRDGVAEEVDPAAPAHDPEVSRVQLGALAHRLLFISQPSAEKLIVTWLEQIVVVLVQTL
jgi:hypothetical protein